jgi:hypothetical protein
MSTTATNPWVVEATSGQGDFELPPAGPHPAYCVGLIDLGTNSRTFNGKTDEVHKVLILWELTAEHMQDGRTFVVHRDFTWSLNVKAKLREFLEAWLGRTIPDAEKFDLSTLVKQPCLLTLTEGTSGAGKKFVEVSSCSRPMRGLTVPAMTVHPVMFSIAECTSSATDPPIPDYVTPLYGKAVVDVIKSSKEWGELSPF